MIGDIMMYWLFIFKDIFHLKKLRNKRFGD